MSGHNVYYIPIRNPDILIEGTTSLLKILLQGIVEKQLKGRSNYTNEVSVRRVRITKIEIEFHVD